MPPPLHSMTGFARVRRPLADGEIVVSVKSLNHRGLDVQVHAPSSADPFEAAIRAMIKSRVARGHVEVRVTLPAASTNGSGWNRTLVDDYLKAFREAAAAHGIEAAPDLNAAFRIPGVFGEAAEAEAPAGAETALLDALTVALEELNVFRAREGAEIAEEMRTHNDRVAAAAGQMEQIRTGASAAFQNRLNERLKELLNTAQIEPQRLAQEAAILADRSDIGEELARLKIHSAQLAALLDTGGEVGKKLDFLLQEMNRESNTILSKTGGIGDAGLKITELALEAKAAIEKIREQSLNLE
ncbi:MAG TPA: YicC/YloC family endoribonuclease [Bryobacteraceae bacterium]|nr:YicC/YloC family endoribonuclease [Bryobacteraceae bacterium]